MQISDKDILQKISLLPDDKKIELIDFLDFLTQRKGIEEKHSKITKKSVSIIEDTWGSIKLNNYTLKYIAEDKSIEYEI